MKVSKVTNTAVTYAIFVSSGISDEGRRGLFYPLFYDSLQFFFRSDELFDAFAGILLAEYKILYGINVASQAADDHVPCVLPRTLITYMILYSARRMPRKLTEQLVRSKEAADVVRYSAYVMVRGRLHIPAGQRTCTLCTGTIELLRHETPDFIGPDVWPANLPDLNPVD